MKAPKKFTVEDKIRICNRVLKHMHEMSMSEACKKLKIPKSNFHHWVTVLLKDTVDDAFGATFAERYARARQAFIDKLAGEILTITDETPQRTNDGKIDHGDVNNRRLRVDTRKWLLSKLQPQKYGDRVQLANDPENPMPVNQTGNSYYNVVVNNYTEKERKDIERNLGSIFGQIEFGES